MNCFRMLLGLTLWALSISTAFSQQAWPSRPIKLVVPSASGGASDTFGRLLATELAKVLGQPLVVENKPGANGRIGTEILLKSPGDGYTLLLSFGSAVVGIPALYPGEVNDARKLQPVARFGSQGALLTVSPDVPVRSLREFVDWAKASKDAISYATYGVGSGAHVAMEALSRSAGLKLVHVPYKESTRVITDLLGGTIKVAALDAVSPIPFIKDGKLRGLAVNGRYRLPATPDIPTMDQQGHPVFLESWYGFFVPKDTPRAIVDRLNIEVGRIVSSPAIQERFNQLNLANTPNLTPEEFAAYIQSESANWSRVINDNAIKAE